LIVSALPGVVPLTITMSSDAAPPRTPRGLLLVIVAAPTGVVEQDAPAGQRQRTARVTVWAPESLRELIVSAPWS